MFGSISLQSLRSKGLLVANISVFWELGSRPKDSVILGRILLWPRVASPPDEPPVASQLDGGRGGGEGPQLWDPASLSGKQSKSCLILLMRIQHCRVTFEIFEACY